MVEILNEENFNGFIEDNEVAFVDFFNEGCIPCRRVSPLISRLETTYGEKVKFGKVKISVNESIVKAYSVEAAPTIILFKNGKEIARHRGAADINQLTELTEKAL